jgi:4-amino-4-deoxy-L-arabinose transferase-like glycosyltransferase
MLALGAIVALGLALRLWGIEYGLPFGYQIDEERLYTRLAVIMLADGDFHPGYFQNPPLYMYVLEAIFALQHGGSDAALLIGDVPDRRELYLTARIVTAVLGTLGIVLLFFAARRFFDTSVALLSALLIAVGFLPVFYSHVALNNVPATSAATLALIGVAGVLHHGRRRDFILAGVGLGLAAATKYTAGIVVLPLLAAALLAPGGRMRATSAAFRGAAIALGSALLAFVLANPHAVLNFSHFVRAIGTQGRLVDENKYGQDPDGGIPFYLESWTWSLGWIPALAAIAGAVLLWRRDRRTFWVLVPVVPIFIVYMGWQTRYFGRWMLPILPIVCMLACYAGVAAVRAVAASRPRLAPIAGAVVALALCIQSLVHVVHNDRVLSRPHTLNVARTWMVENIPETAGVITEPFRARSWRSPWDRARPSLQTSADERQYAEYLEAGLVDEYRARGFCWIMATSNYWGLTLADEGRRNFARGYYERLDREGELVFSASPWGHIRSPGGPEQDVVPFDFDFSYDFYPLSYDRPGPMVHIYRLTGGKCRPPAPA